MMGFHPSSKIYTTSEGNAELQLKNFQEALIDLNIASTEQPKIGDIFFNRAMVKFLLDDKNGGCLDLSKAGELGCTKAYDNIKKYCND